MSFSFCRASQNKTQFIRYTKVSLILNSVVILCCCEAASRYTDMVLTWSSLFHLWGLVTQLFAAKCSQQRALICTGSDTLRQVVFRLCSVKISWNQFCWKLVTMLSHVMFFSNTGGTNLKTVCWTFLVIKPLDKDQRHLTRGEKLGKNLPTSAFVMRIVGLDDHQSSVIGPRLPADWAKWVSSIRLLIWHESGYFQLG